MGHVGLLAAGDSCVDECNGFAVDGPHVEVPPSSRDQFTLAEVNNVTLHNWSKLTKKKLFKISDTLHSHLL